MVFEERENFLADAVRSRGEAYGFDVSGSEKGADCFEIRMLFMPGQGGKASAVECRLDGPFFNLRIEIRYDYFRDRRWINGPYLTGDVFLITEHALVRAAGVGDEKRDDHGIE
jgi:hypothetical protein